MFDEDPPFEAPDNHHTAKEKRKLKKILFKKARQEFSDLRGYKLKYYGCVHEALTNPLLEGKELDKQIVKCKVPLIEVANFIERTNNHARIKVKRCVKSKREKVRDQKGELSKEEMAEWECINRYHRRYLYYYPAQRDKISQV